MSLYKACVLVMVGFILSASAAAPAEAASDVSPKFDGSYAGAAIPAPNIGATGCAAFALRNITITQGILRSDPAVGQPKIQGFITEEGYVSAFMVRSGHTRSPMDGRLENNMIVAGFIEQDTNCHWVVQLARSGT